MPPSHAAEPTVPAAPGLPPGRARLEILPAAPGHSTLAIQIGDVNGKSTVAHLGSCGGARHEILPRPLAPLANRTIPLATVACADSLGTDYTALVAETGKLSVWTWYESNYEEEDPSQPLRRVNEISLPTGVVFAGVTWDGAGPDPVSAPTGVEETAASARLDGVRAAVTAGDYSSAKAGLAEIARRYPETKAGKVAARLEVEVNLIGTTAKPIEVETWYSSQVGAYAANAYTLLVFWEAWDPHSKSVAPSLPLLADKYKARGLGIVGLTKRTKTATDESVTQFIADNKWTFPVGKELDGGMSRAFSSCFLL